MSDVDKIILKMKRQPNGYKMKTKRGTSHRNFINKNGDVITIKEDNPLKAIYVKDVLKRIGV